MTEAKARILVVDDEQSMREFLEIFLRREGYHVSTAPDVDRALIHLENDEIDLTITDMQMPEKTGLDLILAAREVSPETVMIVVTAFGTTDSAISAMKEGAYDYLTKPFKVEELRIVIEKALEKKLLSNENRRLREELRSHSRDRNIIGHSRAMQDVFDLIAQIAETKTNVLVSGESGTGKELVARAIHEQSNRQDQPFVAINCGAIPENLLESELFGHAKGAFTGAAKAHRGLFAEADKGTLFLDEIAEMPVGLQVKLLRAIQEEEIRPVGESKSQQVDVRVIAATARDLETEIAAGRFREDLFYRLNVVRLEVPPLRDRREDIPLLVDHFLAKFREQLGKNVRRIADDALEMLVGYSWPGNVRELENLIERALILCDGDSIEASALPAAVHEATVPSTVIAEEADPDEDLSLKRARQAFEAQFIRKALARTGGNRTHAAKLLEISHRALLYKIKDYGIRD